MEVMKQCSFAIWLGLSAFVATSLSFSAEPEDPFAKRGLPPVRDAAFYAKEAKEEAKNWRGYVKKFLGEPDLEALKSEKGLEVYRFIYRPSFSPHLCLTARKVKGQAILQIRRFSHEWKLELKGSVEMSDDTFAALRGEFARPEVCDPLRGMPEPERSDYFSGLDGATWNLETLRDGKYTRANIWCPDLFVGNTEAEKASFKKTHGFDLPDVFPFVQACLEFVRLSGLPLDASNYAPMPPRPAH